LYEYLDIGNDLEIFSKYRSQRRSPYNDFSDSLSRSSSPKLKSPSLVKDGSVSK